MENWTTWNDGTRWWLLSPSGKVKWDFALGSVDLSASYIHIDRPFFEGLTGTLSPFYVEDPRPGWKFFLQALTLRWPSNTLGQFYARWAARARSLNCSYGWWMTPGLRDGSSPWFEVIEGYSAPGHFHGGPSLSTDAGPLDDPFAVGTTGADDFLIYAANGFHQYLDGLEDIPANVIGCSWSNEPHYADLDGTDAQRYRIGVSTLKAPAAQPAKVALVEWLQQTEDAGPGYATIEFLNLEWTTNYDSWDAFLNSTSVPTLNANNSADLQNFAYYYAKTLFTKVGQARNAVAPGLMLCGSKFVLSWTPQEIVDGMIDSGAVRLATFDDYTDPFGAAPDLSILQSVADPAHTTPLYPDGIGSGRTMPIYCAEVSFDSPQTGNWFGSHATTARAMSAYGVYVTRLLTNPAICGVCWFNGSPFPVAGEGQSGNVGHNEATGWTDGLNTPLPECVTQIRAMGAVIQQARLAATPASGSPPADPFAVVGPPLFYRPGVNGG